MQESKSNDPPEEKLGTRHLGFTKPTPRGLARNAAGDAQFKDVAPPPQESQAVADEMETPVPHVAEAPDAQQVRQAPEALDEQAGKRDVDPAIKWIQWGVVIAGVLVALIFLGLLIMYFKLDDIHEATIATAMSIREAAFRDERAWVAPLSNDSPLTVGSPISINIKILNSGKTFAKNCKAVGHCVALIPPSSPDMSILNSNGNAPSSIPLFIPPGQQIALPSAASTHVILQATLNEIQAGKLRMYIFGKISYDDIFNRHHWIEYCYLYDPKMSRWIETGNCSTDEK
jgi:hypothetical protein